MAYGPGKYDDLATLAMAATNALAAIVIVIDGDNGSGFSAQVRVGMTITPTKMATLLRGIADEVEQSASGPEKPS